MIYFLKIISICRRVCKRNIGLFVFLSGNVSTFLQISTNQTKKQKKKNEKRAEDLGVTTVETKNKAELTLCIRGEGFISFSNIKYLSYR